MHVPRNVNLQSATRQRTGVHLVYSRPGRHGPVVEFRFVPSDQAQVVGSGSLADVHVPDRFVSRRHLSLDWHQGRLYVEDLKSTNGTSLNGLPLAGRRLLTTPSMLQLGALRILVLDGCRLPGQEGVRVGPIVGPACELLPVLHRFLTGTLAPGSVGEFYRRAARALFVDSTGRAGELGMLRLLAPEATLAVRRANG